MQLQNRTLKVNQKGEDVRLLQSELRQLDFQIPEEEYLESRFGRNTRNAVLSFQRKMGLAQTGEVEEDTARQINTERDKLELYEVNGSVLEGRVPKAGIIVRAYDVDLTGENFLGSDVTDEAGRYRIEYSHLNYRKTKEEKGGAELIVRIYSSEDTLLEESEQIDSANAVETVDFTIAIDFRVSGLILDNTGTINFPVRVLAYDRNLRREALLGEDAVQVFGQDLTEEDRRYSIPYSQEQLSQPDKSAADLFIRLLGANGEFFGESDTIYQASREAEIDFTIAINFEPPVVSEYEQYQEWVAPLLGDLSIENLTDEDRSYIQNRLANQPGVESGILATYLQTGPFTATTGIASAFFFGYLRQLPEPEGLQLGELHNVSETTFRSALDNSFNQNILPVPLETEVDFWLSQWRQYLLDEGLLQSLVVAVRVVRADNGEPLAGLQVNQNAFDGSTFTDTVATAQSDGRGLAGFTVILRTGFEEEFAFEVLAEGQVIFTLNRTVQGNFQEIRLEVPAANIPEPPSPTISEVAEAAGLQVPDELMNFFADRRIRTMDHILQAGRLGELDGLPVANDSPILSTLEAHAQHSLIWDNAAHNQVLINKGYQSIYNIGKSTLRDFQREVAADIGQFQSYQIHAGARHSSMALNNILTDTRIRQMNGLETLVDEQIEEEVRCDCPDGESAVGPLAYLADLLDYVLDHVKVVTGGTPPDERVRNINIQDLGERFLQPFESLPVASSLVSMEFCRLRVIVELLRAYVQREDANGNITTIAKDRLLREEIRYANRAYQTLLEQIGSNYAEIRLARFKTTKETEAEFRQRQESLANRLGIDLIDPETGDNRLLRLFLDVNRRSKLNPDVGVTEDALEALFGLRDTRRDILTDTPISSLEQWRLDYLRTLWRKQDFIDDAYRRQEIPVIDPDLIGVDDIREPFAGKPIYDLWLNRRNWIDEQVAGDGGSLNSTDFDGLLARMQQVFEYSPTGASVTPWPDTDLADRFNELQFILQNATKPEVMAAEEALLTDFGLPTDAFLRLMELYAKYQESREDDEGTVPSLDQEEWEEVRNILLQGVKEQLYNTWIAEEQLPDLDNGELPIALLGPDAYWRSLTEPVPGFWSPRLLTPEHPLFGPDEPRAIIDPELLDREDLLDRRDLPNPGIISQGAVHIFEERTEQLADERDHLRIAWQTGKFSALFQFVYADIDPEAELDDLIQRRGSADPNELAQALDQINRTLRLPLPDFDRMVFLRSKAANPDTSLNEDEVDELLSILTSSSKFKNLYTGWLEEETNAFGDPVAYWQIFKARVPKWRASFNQRALWQFALERRSEPPVIDPDVLRPEDFNSFNEETIPGQAALIWAERRKGGNLLLIELDNQWQTATEVAEEPQKLTGFKQILAGSLSIHFDQFLLLKEQSDRGIDIRDRLAQLHLSLDGFEFLSTIYEVLLRDENPISNSDLPIAEDRPDEVTLPIIDSERKEVVAILARAVKERAFREWQLQEENATLDGEPVRLTHSQDFFRIPQIPTDVFPPPEPVELIPWLTRPRDRNRWQRVLKGRIEQEESTREAYRQLLLDTEELTLEELRDALVTATSRAGDDFSANAKAITDRLLVDMQDNTCQPTTRASLAIEVLQGLLNSIHTGQLEDTYPDLNLDAPDFEEEWKWIGSYATWRSAMFVFLYPENVLLPSLRQHQTPAFQELVRSIRNNRRLDPDLACQLVKKYSDYFADVGNLQIESTCEVQTHRESASCRRAGYPSQSILFFQFARTSDTKNAYWSVSDKNNPSDFSDSFWDKVPLKKDIVQIIGTPVYAIPKGDRSIFVFVKYDEGLTTRLGFMVFNLRTFSWEGDLQELDLPYDASDYTCIIKQSLLEKEPPHLIIKTKIESLQADEATLSDAIYARHLNTEGNNWGGGNGTSDWKEFVILNPKKVRSLAPRAVISLDDLHYVLVLTNEGGIYIQYRIYGPSGFSNTKRWHISTLGHFIGGFPLELSQSCNLIYLNGTSGKLNYERREITFSEPNVLATRLDISALNSLLINIFNLDLRSVSLSSFIEFDESILKEVNGDNDDVFDFKLDNRRLTFSFPKFGDVRGDGDVKIEFRNLFEIFLFWEYFSRVNLDTFDLWDFYVSSDGDFQFEYEFEIFIESILFKIKLRINLGFAFTVVNIVFKEFIKRMKSGNIIQVYLDGFENEVLSKDIDWQIAQIQFSRQSGTTSLSQQIEYILIFGIAPTINLFVSEEGFYNWDGKESVIAAAYGRPSHVRDQQTSTMVETRNYGFIANGRNFRTQFNYHFNTNKLSIIKDNTVVISPHVNGLYRLPEIASEFEMTFFREHEKNIFNENRNTPEFIREYLKEVYFFVPLQIAYHLTQRKHFVSALNYYRTVYDYSRNPGKRKIYYGLIEEENIEKSYAREKDWLLDPLNPHTIAETRPGTYTRYTVLGIIHTLLAFADAEFSYDTSESVPRARNLYDTALELLAELMPKESTCEAIFNELEIEVGEALWQPSIIMLREDLRGIVDFDTRVSTLEAIQATWDRKDLTNEKRHKGSLKLIQEALKNQTPLVPFPLVVSNNQALMERKQQTLLQDRASIQAIKTLNQAVHLDYGFKMQLVTGKTQDQLLHDGAIAPPIEPILMGGLRLENPLAPSYTAQLAKIALANPEAILQTVGVYNTYTPQPLLTAQFCIVPNPVLGTLKLSAQINLFKIRNGLNVAGQLRQLDPYAAPIDSFTGIPFLGADGQIVLPGTNVFLPTPFRFRVLIERAKQLTIIAQQLEASFLNTLEKLDAESYTILKARQDLELSKAGIRLQDLRLKEANNEVQLSELQQDRVSVQIEHFLELLRDGVLREEELALSRLRLVRAAQLTSAAFSFSSALGSGLQNPAAADSALASAFSSIAGAISTQSNMSSMVASFKRREQDWQFQLALSQKDFEIAKQQIKLAEDRVDIVEQEKQIAVIQRDQAKETIDFLQNKFTNVELYDWMSNILEGVYSFFLQQATSVAQQATNQLAFERQETPPTFIQQDYFDPPASNTINSLSGNEPDRRGLTGSARLLQDIFQLDQYAFNTDSRKLQLTKTISLASIAPIAFQQFRETGVLTFSTPLEFFDRDFPGHYLRLIKRVRLNMLALVPPIDGIKATLSNTGLSRVTVGETLFQTINVRRDPEVIAFTSPTDATGLFELRPETEFLNPFEATGVDAVWEFKMEKASNFFDYNTIADILMTIEYTALNSFTYRQQVIQRLGRDVSLLQAFSFRSQFSDQWYDLNNPQQSNTPLRVQFSTTAADFAINVNDLFIEQIAVYLSIKDGNEKKIKFKLLYSEQDSPALLGGDTISDRGLASTLQGNAGSWIAMIGKSPIGDWTLAFNDTPQVRTMFKDEIIEDILLMISYNGRTMDWT